MGTKNPQTTTSTNAPPAYYGNTYENLSQQALSLASQPYQPYTGQLTAPINQQQQSAINEANQLYPQVAGLIGSASQPLTAAQIQQYYSPFQQNVIDTTEKQFANTNAQQQQQVLGNAVAQGALGGNRTGVAQAALAGQQQTAEAPVLAGLENTGYNQAVQYAMQQFQQNPETAAGLLSSTGLNTANAQFGYGTAEQQTAQNQLNAQYQQYLAAQGYPFQALNFATGEVGSLGSLAGGTGTVTAPPPSLIAQYGGLGIAGLGAYSAYQNAQARRGGRVLRRQGGLVPHFASGGGPGNLPYAGGPTYIPTEPLLHGAGPPHPVSTSIPNNSNQILQQATKLAGTFGRSGSRDAADDASEDAVYNSSDATFGRAYGGLVLPARNRIEFRRGGPVRAGLGFSSFVPRHGYQYGGSPEELAAEGVPASFDERFPTQPGLAPADFDARFQGQAPPPDLDGGTIMQPTLEPSTVAPAPPPMYGPIQTAGVGQETATSEVPEVIAKGPEATTWQAKAMRAAEAEGVDPKWFAGMIHQESGFNPNVRPSSAGAIGIAQFMSGTAKKMGVDPRNPDQSLQGAAKYFSQLLEKYNGNYQLATAAYNAGPGRVDQSLRTGAPLPAETQAYVPAVMAFAGQGAQGAGETAGLGATEDGYTPPPPPRGRTSGLAAGQERPSGGKGPFGMNSDVSMALMAAGLGMAASRSPFPGVAIGEGGLAGLGAYGSLQRQHLAEQQLERQNARELEQERHARATEKIQQEQFERQMELQKRTLGTPVKIGTGIMGDIMGVPDPKHPGKFIPVDTQGMTSGTGDANFKFDPKRLPTGADPATGVDPKTGFNEGYLQSLPPEMSTLVRDIGNYRRDPASAGYRQKLGLATAVSNYTNGTYRDDIYPTIKSTEREFATGARHGDAILANNNAIGHVETLMGYAKQLPNMPSQTANALYNRINTEFGGTASNTFDAIKQTVSAEILKSIVPGAGGEAERMMLAEKAKSANTLPQITEIMNAFQDLAGTKLVDLKREFDSGTFGKRPDDFWPKLSPQSRHMYDTAKAKEDAYATAHPAGAAPAATATPPAAKTLASQDQQALDWAKANPNDPRAAKIKQRLGVP